MPLPQFALAVSRHWMAAVTGPIVSLAIGVVEIVEPGLRLPTSFYVIMALIGLPWAFYLAWRDQYRRVQELEAARQPQQLVLPPEVAVQLRDKDASITKLTGELARVRTQLPRSLSVEQRSILINGLNELTQPINGVHFHADYYVTDGPQIIGEMMECFREVRWDVMHVNDYDIHSGGKYKDGIWIVGHPRTKDFRIELQSLFGRMGIIAQLDDEAGSVTVVVGKKN